MDLFKLFFSGSGGCTEVLILTRQLVSLREDNYKKKRVPGRESKTIAKGKAELSANGRKKDSLQLGKYHRENKVKMTVLGNGGIIIKKKSSQKVK